MDWDDLEPKRKSVEKRNLDALSVDELGEYVVELQAEIERARKAAAAKEKVKLGAEALFKR
jgi:uncharacterized small protein (DUF1192 family)